MLDRLKFTAKSTLIYSIGSVGIKLIGLILLPIYTDKLSTEQYGMWSLLEVTSQVFLMAFSLRLSTAMLRFYASEKNEKGRAKIIFTAFGASFLSVLIFNLIAQPFSAQLSTLFFDTDEFKRYFTLMVLWTSFEIFNRLVLDLIRVKEKPGMYISVTISKFIGVLLIIIYLIVYKGMGIEGIILGQLWGSVLLLLITLPFVIREMKWKIDLSVFKQMIRYGFPLIFSGMAAFILAVGDRYLIKIFLDYHEVGVYSLSYKLSNVVKIIFVQAFQLGFLPIAFNMYNKPNAERFFSKIFTYYVFIIFWSGLALSMFSKEVIYTFSSNSSFYEAFKYIPYLTLAICFYGIQSFFLIGIHYAKKTHVMAIITTGVMLANIALNVVLIPRIGLMGAAVSYIIAGLAMTILNYIQSQRFYPIPYEIRKVFTIIFLSIGLFILSQLINDEALWIRILIKGGLTLVFPFLLYILKFYEPIEIERILGAWNKWRKPRYWYKNLKEMSVKQSLDSSEM